MPLARWDHFDLLLQIVRYDDKLVKQLNLEHPRPAEIYIHTHFLSEADSNLFQELQHARDDDNMTDVIDPVIKTLLASRRKSRDKPLNINDFVNRICLPAEEFCNET
jgi:hypothetical protein